MLRQIEVPGLYLVVEETPVIEELFLAGFRKVTEAMHEHRHQQLAAQPPVRFELFEPGAQFPCVVLELEEQGSGTERYAEPKHKPATWANADCDEDGFPLGADGQPWFPGRSY